MEDSKQKVQQIYPEADVYVVGILDLPKEYCIRNCSFDIATGKRKFPEYQEFYRYSDWFYNEQSA